MMAQPDMRTPHRTERVCNHLLYRQSNVSVATRPRLPYLQLGRWAEITGSNMGARLAFGLRRPNAMAVVAISTQVRFAIFRIPHTTTAANISCGRFLPRLCFLGTLRLGYFSFSIINFMPTDTAFWHDTSMVIANLYYRASSHTGNHPGFHLAATDKTLSCATCSGSQARSSHLEFYI
ncbi:hypothetical protein BDV95DRAFT_214127 [Massariosphaeria phaeospora]|uniref:Uncharacterized protein n=1 Tax=Massariosphaeria phaeospora TaxID=100035 RepID=A0A7C8HZE5_9PLEO|nr:hypothetical protein BDV95DRAFT_214127 [Massariosphaeria phaeospora]